MLGELPTSISIREHEYKIRTDFRDILNIISAMEDPELKEPEKIYVVLKILYDDFETIPEQDIEEALKKAMVFINNEDMEGDQPTSSSHIHKLMDWEQDEKLIFPAVNKVAGFEVRNVPYLHWWTFLGYYMEITEGVFSTVLSIRSKRADGQRLDKWEQKYFANNKKTILIHSRLTEKEKQAKSAFEQMLAGIDGKAGESDG